MLHSFKTSFHSILFQDNIKWENTFQYTHNSAAYTRI